MLPRAALGERQDGDGGDGDEESEAGDGVGAEGGEDGTIGTPANVTYVGAQAQCRTYCKQAPLFSCAVKLGVNDLQRVQSYSEAVLGLCGTDDWTAFLRPLIFDLPAV